MWIRSTQPAASLSVSRSQLTRLLHRVFAYVPHYSNEDVVVKKFLTDSYRQHFLYFLTGATGHAHSSNLLHLADCVDHSALCKASSLFLRNKSSFSTVEVHITISLLLQHVLYKASLLSMQGLQLYPHPLSQSICYFSLKLSSIHLRNLP